MFRAMFSPIIMSTWLYLQYVVVFTQAAAGWYLEGVETHPRHQPAAAWVNTTTYCKYRQVLLMMGENIVRNMYNRLWNNRWINIVHLVGHFQNPNFTTTNYWWEDNIKMELQEVGGGRGDWSWLRIGTGGGYLGVRWGTFGFHKCEGISWLAAKFTG
jgi:hypothetical protein